MVMNNELHRTVLEAEISRRLKERDVMRECMPSLLNALRRARERTGEYHMAAEIALLEFQRKMREAGLECPY